MHDMIRKAEEKDLDGIMKVIEDGRTSLKTAGIPQWINGYPSCDDILNDIKSGGGRVIEEDGRIFGYCYLLDVKEPTYTVIKGKWLNDDPYITIHRSAVLSSVKGQHLADLFLQAAEKLAREKGFHDLRADTHVKNKPMRAYLTRNGFTECGIVYMRDGSERVAYQKILR